MSRSLAGLVVVGLIALFAGVCPPTLAQPNPLLPPANGPRRADPTWVALRGGTVHVSPDATIPAGTVVFRDGRILAVLAGDGGPDKRVGTEDDEPARLPIGPRVIDATGLHVYAAFIDPYVEVDAPLPDANQPGRHWSEVVTPQRSALDGAGLDASVARGLRELGFGAAAIAPKGGVFRGRAALVSLARPSDDASVARPPVYRADAYQSIALELGSRRYPDSQMGAIALVRQTLIDAAWQEAQRERGTFKEPRNALDWLTPKDMAGSTPAFLLINTDDELEALRCAKIARELKRPAVMLGCGTEFARLEAIRRDGSAFVLPLSFPRAPDVSSPSKAEAISLRDLVTWEQAPSNPRRLAGAGVPFALTTAKLKDRDQFPGNLRRAIAFGLTEQQALAALTTVPAQMLGVAESLGTVEAGKRANLLVASGPAFDRKAKFRMLFIDGQQHTLDVAKPDLSGTWSVDAGIDDGATRTLEIDGGEVTIVKASPSPQKAVAADAPGEDKKDAQDGAKSKGTTVRVKARKVRQEANRLTYVFDHDELGIPGVVNAALVFDLSAAPPRYAGLGVMPDGREFQFAGERGPRSLAGVWPVFFAGGQDPAAGPVLTFAKDAAPNDAPTLSAPGAFETPGQRVEQFSWDGVTLRFTALTEGEAPIKVEARADFSADPPRMRGVATPDGGDSRGFVAVRRKDNPFVGAWRVSKADGEPVLTDGAEQILLDIAPRKVTVTRRVRDESGRETDFVAPGTDESFKGGSLTFAHALAKLGLDEFAKDAVSKDTLTIRFHPEDPDKDRVEGASVFTDGSRHTYECERDDVLRQDQRDARELPEALGLPFGPYALDAIPAQGHVFIDGATLWTNTDLGVIENGEVEIKDGVIAYAGASRAGGDERTQRQSREARAQAGAIVLDATGKHVTPGIIDCHSHTGISKGVNEGGQAVTSEVRIEDVTNPDDVNWYRQLGAGVTSVNSLHGSANAIGGQSVVIKNRWGVEHPDEMHFEGAPGGIKFALGENPRQVNWGSSGTRYPQSRMGVETLIRDRFTTAREYAQARRDNPATRRDLELDALAEVLSGERLVHCHSYRQDEIVMLTQVAREFAFRIGTFQHILEGYKVAEYVRDYSGGGSAFADWWAFKVEVQDAIPYGPPLMAKVGAVVSYNSDSNQLARFLNVEAAKAVKYGAEVGGVSPEDALKFVTLNPAKQLKVESRVGSLAAGLDADVVVWSASPLSTYALCERTFVDGREMYSLEREAALASRNKGDRQRVLNKLLRDAKRARAKGAAPGAPSPDKDASPDAPEGDDPPEKPTPPREADEFLANLSPRERDAWIRRATELARTGLDPLDAPGVCGCGLIHDGQLHDAWFQVAGQGQNAGQSQEAK
jgi:imidazolonepropionase-like amidohydrolase